MVDVFQPSLLACDPPSFDSSLDGVERVDIGSGAWIDVLPGWLCGADVLFEKLSGDAPWTARRRRMWDRVVDEPRLSTGAWEDPPELVREMATALGSRYDIDLSAVSANLYRDGRDSVAWHGDTLGRPVQTTVVAIVSLGSQRRFLVRPKGGGPSTRFTPSHGDLLVMGGTCQRAFDHAVPKQANAGPRISLMFREPGVF
ncbi:MAG: alpha-ketoglutarate-dependent dioxygenase AlkB [Acidimicrobiia bacterium]|nr:alpha-ketoglutarate-dependent dioxygenase AlkB [Acidimicrobiia bacterium]